MGQRLYLRDASRNPRIDYIKVEVSGMEWIWISRVVEVVIVILAVGEFIRLVYFPTPFNITLK